MCTMLYSAWVDGLDQYVVYALQGAAKNVQTPKNVITRQYRQYMLSYACSWDYSAILIILMISVALNRYIRL